MANIDNLENLDNKTLREKCLEYGLPNVPITETSKKLLIRKLRVAMEAEQNPNIKEKSTSSINNAKTRRETINVVSAVKKPAVTAGAKFENEPKKSTRRTMATAPRATDSPSKLFSIEQQPPAAPINNRRRSSRVTPSRQEPTTTTSINNDNKRNTISNFLNDQIILEEDDFDEEFNLIDDSAHKSPIQLTAERKSSVSPSITNPKPTKLLFGKQAIPPPVVVVAAPVLGAPVSPSSFFIPNIPAEIELNESETQKQSKSSKSYIPTRNIDFGRLSTEKESVLPTGYKSIYPTLNKPTATDLPPNYLFGTNTGGGQFVTLPPTVNTTTQQSSTNRRITTSTSYQSPHHLNYPINQNNQQSAVNFPRYNENSDSNDNDDNNSVIGQAPYLSDFARRLSRLKAEPLSGGAGGSDAAAGYRESSKPRDYRRSLFRPGAGNRRPSINRNSSVAGSFKELWTVLDQKYQLKMNFMFIILLSIIILALYYYFF